MEINKFEHEVTGVVVTADVVEGRFGVLTSHDINTNYGSDTDLPGFKVPATAEEAKRARHLVAWAQDNRTYPRVAGYPSFQYGMRDGWDQNQTFPLVNNTTIYLTNPSVQQNLTIPSGYRALAFGKGVYTFPSGQFIASDSWATGAPAIIANTAEDTTDAGKLKYQATFDDRVVGIVRYYDATNHSLTVEVNY